MTLTTLLTVIFYVQGLLSCRESHGCRWVVCRIIRRQ